MIWNHMNQWQHPGLFQNPITFFSTSSLVSGSLRPAEQARAQFVLKVEKQCVVEASRPRGKMVLSLGLAFLLRSQCTGLLWAVGSSDHPWSIRRIRRAPGLGLYRRFFMRTSLAIKCACETQSLWVLFVSPHGRHMRKAISITCTRMRLVFSVTVLYKAECLKAG